MSEPGGVATPPSAGDLVARNVATLGAGELLSRLIGFVATVYVARRLGVDAYGILGFGFAVLLYATALVDAGLEHTGPREVTDAGDRLPDLLSSLLIARFVWALVVAAVVLLVALVSFSGDERIVLALYAAALLPVGLSVRWLHVGLERSRLVSVARVGSEVVRVLAILALVRGPANLAIVPVAQLVGDAFAAFLLLRGVRTAGLRLGTRFDAALTRAVVKRTAPMAVSALLALMVYNADVVFLRIFRDKTEVGLYLAGYTLLNFLGVLGHVVALSLVPSFTRLRDAHAARDSLYTDSIARVFAAGLPMAVGGTLTASLLMGFVFGDEYAPSARVLAILIWCMPIVLLRGVLQAALIARGRQDRVLRTTMSAAVTNFALNLFAVPMFGMYGAAVTTVVAEMVRMLFALRFVRREGFPATPVIRFARTVGAATAMAAVLFVVRPATIWTALPLGAATYAVALMAAGGIRVRRHRVVVTV